MNWESLDWEALDRLRETFLSDERTAGPYWHTITDLECYDSTYGERIGWKWDAVLRELKLRGWSPPPGATVLDWGCGSGIASRRVVDFFGPAAFSGLKLHDHSNLALDYAEHRARNAFPSLDCRRADVRFLRGAESIGLLVVSHVLNELAENGRADLRGLIARAEAVLWVEPGTHEVSRALVEWRESARHAGFNVIAPCTHLAPCGLLAPGNERHWCHFFAPPPPGVHADSGWVKFGQRAGIDLRALPYSFLVLGRKPAGAALDAAQRQPDTGQSGLSRILGEPRFYKGYAKIFGCDAGGVHELRLQKRSDPALFKSLARTPRPGLFRWTREHDRITAIERVI